MSADNSKFNHLMRQLVEEDMRRPKSLLPSAATFKCHCNKLVRLSPSHYIKDHVLGETVQDVVCAGPCRKSHVDTVRIVCARCRAVVATTEPGHDPKLGFTFKPGAMLHVPACEGCVPGLELLKPAPTVPIVELLVADCANRKKDFKQELQLWWDLLLRRLPDTTRASITPRIDLWTRRQ